MIKFTKQNGAPFWLNPDEIKSVEFVDSANTTSINGYFVTESPEEVVRKIMEYKFILETFKSAALNDTNIASNSIDELLKLAGLEEPEHA